MSQLKVFDFSCIDEAVLDLGGVTFIIGPQSSGKSLLSKLAYFFNDIIMRSASENPPSPGQFITTIEKSFSDWFPESSWGSKRGLKIEYIAGQVEFEITRHRTTKSDRIRFRASPFFMAELTRHYADIQAARSSSAEQIQADPSSIFNRVWSLRQNQNERLVAALGRNYSTWQMFAPAGRAFLTSAGKTYSTLTSQVGSDQLISTFGAYLSILRDKQHENLLNFTRESGHAAERMVLAETLLGGRVRLVNDDFALETKDGRVIPSRILSSGQQEILPLLLLLQVWGGAPSQSIFIEEPEAHLWPASQSKLVEYIVDMMNSHQYINQLLITTHSPYVLSKVNNLLRAGSLSTQCTTDQLEALGEIVPKTLWLSAEKTRAYAIADRKLVSLMSDDGLIDAEYLDQASSIIVDEFSRLLEFQVNLEEGRD